MGVPMPLPERIPMPNDEQHLLLKSMGIEIIVPENDTEQKQQYVKYKLPEGWKMVDSSWRRDLPDFYIIDDESKKRISIFGSWKGSYDNELRLRILRDDQIELYVPPKDDTVEASETSNQNIIGQFAEAMDSQKRPYVKQTRVTRIEDYET